MNRRSFMATIAGAAVAPSVPDNGLYGVITNLKPPDEDGNLYLDDGSVLHKGDTLRIGNSGPIMSFVIDHVDFDTKTVYFK